MLVKQEQLNPCEVELEIEVDVEKVKAAVDSAYKELGKSVNIPGFRKGKAPRVVLEQYLDQERVKEHAADKLMQSAYPEALEESKLEPFAYADVDIVKFEYDEPMVFKAKVPLAPKVELGEYKGLEVERSKQEVKDEDIDGEINNILERSARYEKKEDRPVQMGDSVLVETYNEEDADAKPMPQVAEVGKNIPEFDQGIVGMNIDEEKVISITYPEDHKNEDLKGKTVPLHVKVVEINEKILPELNDEWVKATFTREPEEGKEPDPDAVDTLEKLRGKVRESFEKAAEDVAKAGVETKIVSKVVENAEICFPQVMVTEAVHERFEHLLKDLENRNVPMNDYLKYLGKSLDELKDEFEKESAEMLKTSLVFREIMEKESIDVSDEEVESEIEAMASGRGVPVETMTAFVEKTDGKPGVKNRVLRKKIVDFLVDASKIKDAEQS